MKAKCFKVIAISFIVILFSTKILTAQLSGNLKQKTEEAMLLYKQKKYFKGLSPFNEYITDSTLALISGFRPFINDSIDKVRAFAYDIIAVAGQKNGQQNIRQQAIDILVIGCYDKNVAIRKTTAKHLKNFLKADFSENSKQKLAALLGKEPIYYRHTVRILGYLEMNEQINKLKSLLNSDILKDRTLKWDIQLTLARLGEEEQIGQCVTQIKQAGLNDNVVYHLFPDLAYIKANEAVDYMVEILNSDSRDCFSPNPDNPIEISCAYRVLEYLAPLIKDFPLKTNRYGELDVDDYEEALLVCRRWFKRHISDYMIDRSRY